MKNKLILIALLFSTISLLAQKTSFTEVQMINRHDSLCSPFNNNSKYTIVLLSSMFCGKCINELETYSKVYPDWKEKYNITVFAVNVDACASYESRIERTIKKTNYSFETYIDKHKELTKYLATKEGFDLEIGMIERYGELKLIPLQAILIDKEGRILKQTKGFKIGYEQEMEAFLQSIQN